MEWHISQPRFTDFIPVFVVGKHFLKEYAKAGNDVKREYSLLAGNASKDYANAMGRIKRYIIKSRRRAGTDETSKQGCYSHRRRIRHG
jgi:hypothetical protein